jgi:hypothetical protein
MTTPLELTYSGTGEYTVDAAGPLDVTVTAPSDLTLIGKWVGPLTVLPGATVRFRGSCYGAVFVGVGATLIVEPGSVIRSTLINRGKITNLGTRQVHILELGDIDDSNGVVLEP